MGENERKSSVPGVNRETIRGTIKFFAVAIAVASVWFSWPHFGSQPQFSEWQKPDGRTTNHSSTPTPISTFPTSEASRPTSGDASFAPGEESERRVQVGRYNIRVAGAEGTKERYSRVNHFGDDWGVDVNQNGCDTRNDILARDLENVELSRSGCVVISGTMVDDPYTGETYPWVRGVGTSTLVQIDHVIPLKYAWEHGAAHWSQAEREEYANDPDVLIASHGPSNASKQDKGPARWPESWPANMPELRCNYAQHWLLVADKWNIAVNPEDADWLVQTHSLCEKGMQ